MNSQKSKLGVWWEKAILLIEDNQDDALLTARALHEIQPDLNVKIVENGRAAIGYLRGEGPYSDRRKYPLPDLVLLDWLMVGSSGEEVLQWMRAERALEGMGVVVMTG